MSLTSWKAEFYPTNAKQVVPHEPESTMDQIVLVKHSLTKWCGLTEENIKKHGLVITGGDLVDEHDDVLAIDDSSCSLCVHFMHRDKNCNNCPLFKTLDARCDDGKESPWFSWMTREDPQLMIKALEETLENLEVQLEDERIQERIKHEEEEEANKS